MDGRRAPDSRPPADAGESVREPGQGPVSEGHATGPEGGARPNSVPPPWAMRILLVFLGISVAAAAAGFVVDVHGEHPLEDLPLFYPLYGFLGISGLILASKALRRLVMRREDYYDAE